MNGERAPAVDQRFKRRCVLLFVFLSVVYHSNFRPIASGDSLPASLIPFSLLLDGSIALDRFGPYVTEHVPYASAVLHKKGGHWYSTYPIAGPMLAAPFYLPIAFVPWFRDQPPGTLIAIARVAEKVVAVALAAAAAIGLLFLLRRLTSERRAWMLTLLFALGTGNWSTASQALWQHSYGQLAIIGCLYAIERWSSSGVETRWYWAAGVFAACAIAIRPTNLALLPALAPALWEQRARITQSLRVIAPTIPAGGFILAYNLTVFQNAAGGYPAKLDGRLLEGLGGVLLSPGRGLLVYTPIAIFAIAAFAPGARDSRGRHRPVVAAAGIFCLCHIAMISLWPVWWGGYCWGPRLLTEILAPVMTLVAAGLPAIGSRTVKGVFAVAAVYCCSIQAIGVYCYPKGRWDHLPVTVNDAPARLWNVEDNPIVRTARGGIAWEPYAIVAGFATGGRSKAAKKLHQLGINPF